MSVGKIKPVLIPLIGHVNTELRIETGKFGTCAMTEIAWWLMKHRMSWMTVMSFWYSPVIHRLWSGAGQLLSNQVLLQTYIHIRHFWAREVAFLLLDKYNQFYSDWNKRCLCKCTITETVLLQKVTAQCSPQELQKHTIRNNSFRISSWGQLAEVSTGST